MNKSIKPEEKEQIGNIKDRLTKPRLRKTDTEKNDKMYEHIDRIRNKLIKMSGHHEPEGRKKKHWKDNLGHSIKQM